MKKNRLNFGIFLLTCLFSIGNAYAKINLYDLPRDLPQIPFYDENDRPLQADGFKGKLTLLVFWSRNCAPCVKELRDLSLFKTQSQKDDIEVFAVSPLGEWQDVAEIKEFLFKRKADDLGVYYEKNGDLSANFGIFTYPNTVLINEHGKEIGRISGAVSWLNPKVIKYIYNLRGQILY